MFSTKTHTTRTPELGSVISGTLRTCELLGAFIDELSWYDKEQAQAFLSEIPENAVNDEKHEWWGTDDADILLNEELFDALNDAAPFGMHFGPHPGDGGDFGWWVDWYFFDEAIQFGETDPNDPERTICRDEGLIIHTSDHGSITVYDLLNEQELLSVV